MLIVLSAAWRPGTIQVFTPNLGRITACSKNQITNTITIRNSSFIAKPPGHEFDHNGQVLPKIVEYPGLKSKVKVPAYPLCAGQGFPDYVLPGCAVLVQLCLCNAQLHIIIPI